MGKTSLFLLITIPVVLHHRRDASRLLRVQPRQMPRTSASAMFTSHSSYESIMGVLPL